MKPTSQVRKPSLRKKSIWRMNQDSRQKVPGTINDGQARPLHLTFQLIRTLKPVGIENISSASIEGHLAPQIA